MTTTQARGQRGSALFDGNDYSGEQQIVDTLAKRGKLIPSDRFDAEFETLRLDAEDILFDADAVQFSSLRGNAAVRPAWFWLPRGGERVQFAACRFVLEGAAVWSHARTS